jgi:hypothetical protein
LSVTPSDKCDDGFVVTSFSDKDDWQRCKAYVRDKLRLPLFEPKTNGSKGSRRQIVVTYQYTDAFGELLFEAVRFQPKSFAQRRPDGKGGWVWNLDGVERTIYRLPEVYEALALEKPIFVVEGEKDVDALWKIGIPATCNPQGAGKWRDEYSQILAGAVVYIIPDQDEPGRKHAQDVAQSLTTAGAAVRVLDLPKGKDVSDWLGAGGSAEQLHQLANAAPPWSSPAEQQEQRAFSFDPKPYQFPDPAKIPPREWLLGKHYIRGAVGADIGAPGRCKSTTVLTECVGMAAGRDLFNGRPLQKGPLHCAYLNGEETQDELDRRVAAICQHFNIAPADCAGRLWVIATREKPIRVATTGQNGAVISTDVVNALKDWCDQRQLDVLACDPLVSFHYVRENSNEDMDLVCKEAFAVIAGTTRAVDLVHHPRKLAPGESTTTVDDARGASAILAAVRVARTFNFMTTAEAAQLGIPEEERRRHVRIDNGKASQGPLGTATWVKIKVENLPNGDEVAVASPWDPPNPFDGVTTTDVEVAVKLARSNEYRADSRSPKWFGYALAERLNIAVAYGADNDPKDLARLNTIIKTWLKNKVLAIDERKDEQSKKRKFIVPGSKRPAVSTSAAAADDEIIL